MGQNSARAIGVVYVKLHFHLCTFELLGGIFDPIADYPIGGSLL